MNILEKIVEYKRKEIAERKSLYPVKLLENSIYFNTPIVSLSQYLRREDRVGIIAEIKRRSPSEEMINEFVDIEQTSIGYMQAGASALSILTDNHFFGGSNKDLTAARKFNYCPILRKDFIIDEYQIIESKSIGADAILLIAACLAPDECNRLARFAQSIGLEVLLEVRSKAEIDSHLGNNVNVVGVNNRNLDDFSITLDTSLELVKHIPETLARVSESGISNPSSVVKLKNAGFDGFLVGTHFMRQAHPEIACSSFIKAVLKEMAEEKVPA
jgi:indole-3-glycerol phosphate synthase